MIAHRILQDRLVDAALRVCLFMGPAPHICTFAGVIKTMRSVASGTDLVGPDLLLAQTVCQDRDTDAALRV